MLLCCLYHVAYAIHIYSTPDRRTQYCNERVCLSVCVCLSTIISSELHVRFSQFFYACYLWPWLGLLLAAN